MMINQHPMRPKQEQLDIWNAEYFDGASLFDEITTRAFQWGADCQLEQVVQAWNQCMEEPGTDIQVIRRFDQKLKALRPQENN